MSVTTAPAPSGGSGLLLALADLADPPPNPYVADPVAWLRERLKVQPWSLQRDIAEALVEHKRVAVKACHGPGKSWLAARLAAWWIDTHPPGTATVITTAPTFPQVQGILWKELRRGHREGNLPGRIGQDCTWKLDEGDPVAVGRKPADHNTQGFQGVHDDFVLVIADEADGIPADLYLAIDSVLTNEQSRLLCIGNPDNEQSHFATMCAGAPDDEPGLSGNGEVYVITIPADKTPLFTGEEIPDYMKTKLVSPAWVEQFINTWGKDSPAYESKVRARFPRDKTTGVIPYGKLLECRGEEAEARVGPIRVPVELGVDIAASDEGTGGDETVVYERRGMRVGRRWAIRSSDELEVADLVSRAIKESGCSAVKYDANGVGWGLGAIWRTRHPRVKFHPIKVSERSTQPSRFDSLRDEVWWNMRELVRDGGIDMTEVDDKTLGELSYPRWEQTTAGRIKVEPKEKTKKRLGRSPDNADALNNAFYVPKTGARKVQKTRWQPAGR